MHKKTNLNTRSHIQNQHIHIKEKEKQQIETDLGANKCKKYIKIVRQTQTLTKLK